MYSTAGKEKYNSVVYLILLRMLRLLTYIIWYNVANNQVNIMIIGNRLSYYDHFLLLWIS